MSALLRPVAGALVALVASMLLASLWRPASLWGPASAFADASADSPQPWRRRLAGPFAAAAANGVASEEAFRRARAALRAWLTHADPRTLLLPDYLALFQREGGQRNVNLYTPHNSAADNYPYLVATAFFTDPALYAGRMREMLRNDIRYASDAHRFPHTLDLKTGEKGPPALFGAAEYGKDGLVAITELLGRTPWFHRLEELTTLVMEAAPIDSAHGRLPDRGAEVNGDLLQSLVRLAAMTGNVKYLHWAERIGDAYVREVLPGNHDLPGYDWDFAKHEGPDRLRLRDHGNEIVVGLVLLHALEAQLERPRAAEYRGPIGRMLERILASANQDGMFYNEVRCSDLQPLDRGISDNWGYIYGAMYTYSMVSGDDRYRAATRRLLANLPKYRSFDWEHGRQDGYADAIESALYLVAREPVPEAFDWIETEIKRLIAYQGPDGMVEGAYPDGNWMRTMLLYALFKTQGAHAAPWQPGLRLGARSEGSKLYVSLTTSPGGRPWRGRLHLDTARHRLVLGFARNYPRINEWPEWYVVEQTRLYRVTAEGGGAPRVVLGSELSEGLMVSAPARIVIEPEPRP